MSIEGVWTTEISGPFGWETVGVLVLDAGRAAGGNNNHFSLGRYEIEGDELRLKLHIDFYGTPRSLFGVKEEKIDVEITGRIAGDAVSGVARRPDKPGFDIECHMTRRGVLPAADAP